VEVIEVEEEASVIVAVAEIEEVAVDSAEVAEAIAVDSVEAAEAETAVEEAETVVEEVVAVLVLEPALKSSSKLTRDSPESTFNVEPMTLS